MTPADREEVKKIALENCESSGSGCATYVMLLVVAATIGYVLMPIIDKLEKRISALESQVKELKEAADVER